MTARLSQLSVGLLYLATASTVVGFAPDGTALLGDLRAPHRWLDRVGTDAATAQLAGALLWLVALWLSIGLLASCLSVLPGAAGRCFATLARRTAPVAVRRLIAASTGASLLFSPLAALAEPASAAHQPATAVSPAWPIDQATVPAKPAQPAQLAEPPVEPQWPTDPAPTQASWPAAPEPRPAEQPPPAQLKPPAAASPAAGSVLVQPGDSLWTIAAEQLGPTATDEQIAVQWPYWYRANRGVIGRDPGLIRAGSKLIQPDQAAGDRR
ncbi:MAG: hypothetical protein ABI140_12385 [Jatrophihabitantaceae bacterium]